MDSRLLEPISNIQMVRNFSGNIIADVTLLIDIALRYFALSGIKIRELQYFSKSDIADYYKVIDKNRRIQKKVLIMSFIC